MGAGRIDRRNEFWARLIAATSVMRAVIATVSLSLCWVARVIPAGDRVTFTLLELCFYLPFGALMFALRRRWSGDALARAMVTGDVIIVFLFELLVPSIGVVALLGYVLLTGFYAATAGTRLGVAVATCTLALAWVAQTLSPAHQVNTFTLVMFGSTQGGLVALLHEARRAGREAEAELAYRATHDPLTELPNRALLVDRLQVALSRSARRADAVATLFLDLDDFKVINDSLGHAAGDTVLRVVAQRLAEVVRPGDTVARFGGDEFVVLCDGLDSRAQAHTIAERLVAAVHGPVALATEDVWPSASIGIAFAGADGAGPDDLLRDADAAMYRAKELGRGGIVVFDDDLRSHALTRLTTEAELRRVLERGELELFYQPGVDLETDQWVAVEALLRWRHPVRGLLQPRHFLDVAEETGLIVPIGAWVLHEACSQLARWRVDEPATAPMAVGVNVSGRQLAHGGFDELVSEVLAESGLEPWRLYLEVTETTLMEGTAGVASLEVLADAGVMVGIDDFGTGYSSLERLCRLPLRFLKLDRSFLSGEGRVADPMLLAAVYQLAYALRLPVVAEGPETEAHVAVLREAGVRFAQGNWFGRPAPAEEITARLRQLATTVS